MSVLVRIPTPLRKMTNGEAKVEIESSSLGDLVEKLDAAYPGFKARLLDDASTAIAELDYSGAQGEDMVVVENTAEVHNVVVCTLCSCYPWPVLGLPPGWYKSFAYRARIVREPRAVLAEFDTRLPDGVEVRVHDSTADMRYLVLPRRPDGAEGMDEDALAALVTRDSMIGVTTALSPEPKKTK